MSAQILLLRGINVGGHNKLPMAELRAILSDCGAEDVSTYIQSGNAVFRGDLVADQIEAAIEAAKGFRPVALLRDAAAWRAMVRANPFPDETADPKALHVFLFDGPAQCEGADLSAHAGAEERFLLSDNAVYLHTPKYLSGSKLAPKLERLIGQNITGRNWRSVEQLSVLLAELGT